MSSTTPVLRGLARTIEAADRVTEYMSRHGIRHGLKLAASARPGREGTTEILWPGYRAPFRLRLDGGSDVATFNEVIADECYALPFDAAPVTIIDAGANIGLTAAYFARTFPAARIVSLEPDPENFKLLIENTQAYPNVHPVQGALWVRSETVRLGDPNAGPRAYRIDSDTTKGFDVPALDVLSLMERFEMSHIDLLKVDIEGAEVEIFDESASWIEYVSSIAVELHDRFRPGCSRSFFRAVADFPGEWSRGETTFVKRVQ